MGKDMPFIVTFIGDLNFLGAILSIISLFPNFTTYLGMEFKLMPIFINKYNNIKQNKASIFLIPCFFAVS